MKRVMVIVLMMVVALSASAVTRTWSGAVNGNWSNAGNWDVQPTGGENLLFPANAANRVMNNDFGGGLTYGVSFLGDYSLAGSMFTLGSSSLNASGNVAVTAPVGIIIGQTWDVDGTLDLGSTLEVTNFPLIVDGNGTMLFSAINGTTGSVTTTGALLVTFRGATTYTGATTIGGTSVATISTNSFAGPLIVQNGAKVIIPANAAWVQGNYSLANGATQQIALDGTATNKYSNLRVDANVTLGGTLQFSTSINPPAGTQFTIINKTSAGAVTGTFAGLAEGGTLTATNQTYTISYVGGDGNDVVLTAGAPPATATTLALNGTPDVTTYGQDITLTATITPASATGTITFKDGANVLGTAMLVAGEAQLVTPALTPGFHSVTAMYGGNASHQVSTSPQWFASVFKSAITVDITSTPNPSAVGQNVQFNVTITPPAASHPPLAPSGNVTLFDGPNAIDTKALDSSGAATMTVTGLGIGNHNMSVSYAGDARFNSGGSPYLQMVGVAASTTSVTSSLNPSAPGQSITFTATVTPSAATGTITFKNGATTIAVVPLASGVATYTTAGLAGGSHNITAAYGGDIAYAASTSPVLTQQVFSATTTTLTTSLTPSTAGQNVKFTATVTPVGATGTVTFKDGTTTIGTGTLDGTSIATLLIDTLSVGTHSITAIYNGDAAFSASTSAPLIQTMVATTTTVVATSKTPSTIGQSITFTATVTPSDVTGNVTFKDGATTLGTGTLNGSGIATFTTTALAQGPHTITAVFPGDPFHFTSTSQPITQLIQAAALPPTTTTITSNNNPSTVGQFITLTATVLPSDATGTVTFTEGSFVLATVALNGSGQASISSSSFAAGSHFITATYSGDATHELSVSPIFTQVVNGIATSTALTSSLNPSNAAQSVTFTATVTPSGATGNVTFRDGATILGSVALNPSAVATFTTASLTAGSHSITATYDGSVTYAQSTSPVVTQLVNAGPSLTPTTIALTSSPNPSTFGHPANFTATISPSTATGTVDFFEGNTLLGTMPVDDTGHAKLMLLTLAPGPHVITAVYSGDATFASSTSTTVSHAVVPAVDNVAAVPALDPPMLILLGLALAAVSVFVLRR